MCVLAGGLHSLELESERPAGIRGRPGRPAMLARPRTRKRVWLGVLTLCVGTLVGSGVTGGHEEVLMAADAVREMDPLPWLTEVQTPPRELPPNAPRLSPLLLDAAHRPITTPAAWRMERARLRQRWLDFLGRFPEERGPVHLTVLEEDRPAGCVRQLVRYEAEPGLPVEGYLVYPDRLRGLAPGVVVLHQTTESTIRQAAGLEGPEALQFGLKLARRGFVTFSPRCYLWQYREQDYLDAVRWLARRRPGVRGLAKMLHDARRAVDVLQSVPFVDRERIGAIGHSLGGKEALFLAGFDERVKATVSSEGGIGLGFCNWDAPWYLGPEIRRRGFPLENHQVLALVPPRAFLLLAGDNTDGDKSWPFIEAVLPIYDLLGAPRRIGLFNHRHGHSVPPQAEERAYAWLEHFLAGTPPAGTPRR